MILKLRFAVRLSILSVLASRTVTLMSRETTKSIDVQWLAEKLDFLANYYVNEVTLRG